MYCITSLSPSLSLPLSPFLSLPPSATATGSAGKHWRNEKIFTVGLLGLIPLGLVYPNAVVDYGLAVAIPLHGHWSVENVAIYGI
jgi:succinate dehydrogenase (ubiquinone) membrane anchor subunit